ncbi:hemagglutinin-neuraminidase protein [avian paramyxovirus 16]|uniref:Hemagglutinin-neuraminidase n=1 Tax=avian paramyxovirus 16 TaxID=2560322 RepID=A0A1Z1G737_9MONO|nr:hemagglutinin-neuraminidase protein [Avian paramyxovirus UPO216]ARV85979.1 hemagglutinin-neuraminidase protein [Avian paramyxovirus UPO216]
MERGISEVALANDRTEEKNTWRLIFRITVLVVSVITLGLTAASLVYSMNAAQPADFDGIIPAVQQVGTSLTNSIGGMQDVLDRTYKQVALESPLTLLNMESTIMNAITSLSYKINNGGNSSGCGAPIHDPEYIGGIGKELLIDDNVDVTSFYPSAFKEHLNFIPAPTTGAGCTRIPSFDLSATHYCYTHNVILSGCQDHSHSHQYIALGVLKLSDTGNVFFSTLRSINLDDTANRKSCSISATPLGCDILCSKVTETELEDYKSEEPTPMVHGRLSFDGTYSEKDLDVNNLFSDWTANYPSVGGGSYIGNRVWYAVYGGLKPGSNTDQSQRDKYVIYKRYNNTCPDPEDYQINKAKSSYTPSYFGSKRVQQAILSIAVSPTLGSDPVLTPLSNDVVLMGAEGRVMHIGGYTYLYQRGTSYYSPALLYPLNIQDKSATASSPYKFDAFTRPGSVPCQADARCPQSCVTGVYTDPYPLIFAKDHSIRGVYGMMLNDVTARLNPIAAVFSNISRSQITRVSSSSTKAAYTTSTCFKVIKTNRIYCMSIAEISNTLFGEFRIVPLLVEILSNGGNTARSAGGTPVKESPKGWSDAIAEPLFCTPTNVTRYNADIRRYAYSWP